MAVLLTSHPSPLTPHLSPLTPNMTDDTSGYITIDYEGISSDFTEIESLPSSGTCDLFRAKRYGRWYLLKCLKVEYATDSACQHMLRK
ncbi:MAG: hypothetical protein J6Y23_08165 [Prevotella sp.]|nr:hypothetical protein [Prevotella sp.]